MVFWKCNPWSVTNCLRNLNLAIMWLNVNKETILPSFRYVGIALAHLVKYSTTTIMYLWPWADAGWHVVKSIPHLAKGMIAITGCKGARCERIFLEKIWHGWNFLTSSTRSLKIEGQKYPARNIFWVVSNPERWLPHAPLWQSCKTFFASSWVRHCRSTESTPHMTYYWRLGSIWLGDGCIFTPHGKHWKGILWFENRQ